LYEYNSSELMVIEIFATPLVHVLCLQEVFMTFLQHQQSLLYYMFK